MNQEYLEQCLKNAYSIESREKWEKENLSYERIGTVQRGKRLYDVYEDSEKNYWYSVRIITKQGIVSEYKAIFGTNKVIREVRNKRSYYSDRQVV